MTFSSTELQLLRDGFSAFHIPILPDFIAKFSLFYTELVRWNQKTNLIGTMDSTTILVRHFIDSLSLYPLLTYENASILDIGSGAGFPSIPIAVVAPQLSITAAERRKKRASFLRNVVHLLQLENVTVRETDVRDIHDRFDIIVARAVGDLSTIFKLAKNRRKEKSMIIAFKGKIAELKREVSRLKATIDSAEDIGIRIEEVKVPHMEEERHIVIIETK